MDGVARAERACRPADGHAKESEGEFLDTASTALLPAIEVSQPNANGSPSGSLALTVKVTGTPTATFVELAMIETWGRSLEVPSEKWTTTSSHWPGVEERVTGVT